MSFSEKIAQAKLTLKPGLYRHYKGGEYQLLDIAVHSETEELVVVYKPLYGEQALWVRPLKMFQETIEIDGQQQSRFSFIGSSE